jgi:hypothetical protein
VGYSDAYPGGYGVVAGLVTSLFIETDPDTWWDATDQLISGSTNQGKQNELDRYQAGTMTVVLDNDDRTFDPTYASSPLAGHILPMKRVRLTAAWDGVEYPLFFGYADRWTQNREGPRRGTTTLQATDGFKVLERARLASSPYAQEILADAPVHWWRLGEFDGSTTAVDNGASPIDASVTGDVEFGTDGLISRDADTSLTTIENDTGQLVATGAAPPTNVFTLEMVVRASALPSVSSNLIATRTTTGGADSSIVVSSAGQLTVTIGGTWSDAATLAANTTYHLAVTTDGTTARVYVNGVESAAGSRSANPAAPGNLLLVGPAGDTIAGVFDEIAIYDTALSAARIAAHASAVTTPWDGDLPGPRIDRVLDAVGYTGGSDIDTGMTTLQSAELNMSALEHVQKVAETEFGNLYVTADGTLRFEDRESAVNQPVVATFSDAPGGDLPITFSDPEISDEHIRNNVTVSRLEGVAQTVRDAMSIAAYQISSYTRDGLYHDNDAHSRYLAQFILAGYKDPVERVSQMAVNPYSDDTLWPVILSLELTDRVVLNETPQHVAPEVSRTVVVEGITHTFGPKSWVASFNLSENTAATQPYWALGVAGFSELGETTRLYL